MQRPRPVEAGGVRGKEAVRRPGLSVLLAVSRSHMEPEPQALPCLLGGREPCGEQRGGHEAPTCLGGH